MNKKILISARSGGNYHNNQLFKKNYAYFNINKKKVYREDSNIGLVQLKKVLIKYNCIIKSSDLINKNDIPDLEIHIFGSFKKENNCLHYCVLPEIEYVAKNCNINLLKQKYQKIFTNIKKDIDNKKVFEINQPQARLKKKIKFYKKRKFACIIANNKSLLSNTSKSGYIKRIHIINWYKLNNPKMLDVYGSNWNFSYSSNYYLNRLFIFLNKKFNFNQNKNSCFKGIIKKKIPILQKYKFAYCLENYYGLEGYLTEKIFDCFYAGCIPIYLGCTKIHKSIPQNCFIDFRNFKKIEDLHNFLEQLTDKQIENYRKNIFKFISSRNFSKFFYKNFINILLKHIRKDLIKK